MKILHTSDWHLGQKFYRQYDREEEHDDFINQLHEIIRTERPDVMVLSGDVFDSSTPSNAVQTRFVKHILSLHNCQPDMTIVITAGNHDSASLIEVNRLLWEQQQVYVIGSLGKDENCQIDLDRLIIPLADKAWIIALPHIWPGHYPSLDEGCDSSQRQRIFYEALYQRIEERNAQQLPVVMMAHLAIRNSNFSGHNTQVIFDNEPLIGNMEQYDLQEVGDGYDYLALGHIHAQQTLRNQRARYCGSPIPLSFDEPQHHSVTIVEVAGHGDIPIIREVPIRPLRKMLTLQATDAQDAKGQLINLPLDTTDYIRVIVSGDMPLSTIEKAELDQIAMAHEQCRYCGYEFKRVSPTTHTALPSYNVRDLQQSDPLDIAKKYAKSKDIELTQDMVEMLSIVLQEIRQEEQQ